MSNAPKPATKPTSGPVAKFRAGAVGVSVFKREFDGKEFYSASVGRAYIDEKDLRDGPDGTWKYTDSLGRDDLPVAAALLNQAFAFIVAQTAAK
jgi:hypothetical protein